MRRRSPEDDESEEQPEEAEGEDDEPSGPPRARRPHGRSPRSIRPWKPSSDATNGPRGAEAEEEDSESEDASPGLFHRIRRPVFYRASDTVWFEPLVALAVVILILVSLYAYTDNWPPAYVIESDSMQHGLTDQVGLINTGDLVLAQRISASQVTTYITGMNTGYRTYGEFGDVILYYPNGDTSTAPIIHRALLYVDYNPSNRTYSMPQLLGDRCGTEPGAVYRVAAHLDGCGPLGVSGELTLLGIGWMGATVNVSLTTGVVGTHSGFLTMGDNNFIPGDPPQGEPDQPALSTLVEPGWMVGVARGMIPWFGSLKLLLSGDAGMVPPQSWEWLAITLIGTFLAAMGVHYALRAEGIEDERRKEDEREEEEAEGDRPPRRWRGLVPWRRSRPEDSEDDEEEDDARPARHGRPRPRDRGEARSASGSPRRGGRPKPHVGRTKAPPRRRRPSDSEDDL